MIEISFENKIGEHVSDIGTIDSVLNEVIRRSKITEVREEMPSVTVAWDNDYSQAGGQYSPLTDEIKIFLNTRTTKKFGATTVLGHELFHAKRREKELLSGCAVFLGIPATTGLLIGAQIALATYESMDSSKLIETAVALPGAMTSAAVIGGLTLWTMTSVRPALGSRLFHPISELRAHKQHENFDDLDDFITYIKR